MKLLLIASFFICGSLQANLMEGFDSLGGNEALVEKARALEPEAQITIVQERKVSLRMRSEVTPEIFYVLGGEPYLDTKAAGVGYTFHINPRLAVGARYSQVFNDLSPEGQSLIYRDNKVPDLDYMESQAIGVVQVSPIYGKFNFFDLGVVQFDTYGLLGGGQVQLKKGSQPTYTAGGGFAFWISNHISARTELRWQTYEANYYDGKKNLNLTIASFGLGVLL